MMMNLADGVCVQEILCAQYVVVVVTTVSVSAYKDMPAHKVHGDEM